MVADAVGEHGVYTSCIASAPAAGTVGPRVDVLGRGREGVGP